VRITDLPDRIQSKIAVASSGCWEWQASCLKNGYGQVRFKWDMWLAHRLTYELLIGPIPEGLTIDHLCRNKPCCNPAHLEPVTQEENYRRHVASVTACPSGHPYTGENTATTYKSLKDGTLSPSRSCRECSRRKARNQYRVKHGIPLDQPIRTYG
jgi:hypothetical protein